MLGTSLAQAPVISGDIAVTWDYAAAELPEMTFRVYTSQDIAVPMAQWQLLATVVGTNYANLTVIPGRHYFVCTASNFWTSEFSNVTHTPGVPSQFGIGVQKGHRQ